MFKKCGALLACLAVLLSFSACGGQADESPAGTAEAQKLKISVTFNAMKEFAEAVGGDKAEVSAIIPDGTEPHSFEPKAQDLIGLSTAQVFVYNGLAMEKWVDQAVEAASNKNLIVVEASKGVTPVTNTGEEEIKEHGQYDPHIWLSLKGAETEVQNIRDAFVKADPANQTYYENNCTQYLAKLESLYNEYAEKFKAAPKKNFVTGHAAFAYLCRDFDLHQNSVEGVFAEGEPSAQQLSALVQYCRDHDVTTIFAEEMASPEVSKTLADEVGAKVETIYTMESAEDNKTYLERSRENLQKIYASLSGQSAS